MEVLRDSILMLCVRNYRKQKFVPEARLFELLTADKIIQACKNTINDSKVVDITDAVFRKARKVFAILVLIGHLKLIEEFVKDDHFQESPLDHKLPFSIQYLQSILPNLQAELFHDQQWVFCAPYFSDSRIPRYFQDQTILPYQKNVRLTSGGFGVVFDVEINDAHHRLSRVGTTAAPGVISLVRKEMAPQENDFETEVQNLSFLNLLKHPNVVHLLSCYHHEQNIHLLFPKASEGDLGDLLTSERPSLFARNESFLIAFTGLASAIHSVHEFTAGGFYIRRIGCHHDLKPKNVLVDAGRFILADFGLSRFKHGADGSKTHYRTRNGYEIAPECQSLNGKVCNTVHRSSDIWSFGCIVANVLAYMRRGKDGVESFKQARKFNNDGEILSYFHRGDTENRGMHSWLQELVPECSSSERMLLELVRQILVLDPGDRPLAGDVVAELQFITLHALAQEISRNFGRFESMTGQTGIELLIEKKSFMGWQHSLGLISDHTPDVSLKHLSGCDNFEGTLDRLESLQNVLETSDPLSKNIRRRLILPFRQHNSSLLAFLEHSIQTSANMYLETSLLEAESTEYLQLLSQYIDVKEIGHMADTKQITLRALSGEAPMDGLKLSFDSHTVGKWRNIQLDDIKSGTESDKVQYSADESCLIEWKRYEDPVRRDTIEPRIQAIASLLRCLPSVSRFRILPCKGYCHKPDRKAFGLAYSIPKSLTDRTITVSTLKWFLLQGEKSRKNFPDLGTRLSLAQALSSTVLDFHNVSWLHRRLLTANILFFHDTMQPLSALTEPYIIGILYSRKNEPSAFTEGVDPNPQERDYLHPRYLKNDERFEPGFDYYSLGLILFEIGVWKPLHDMIPPTGSPESIAKELLTGWMPVLKSRAGIEYSNCVKACLNDSLLRADPPAGAGAERSDEDNSTAIYLKFSESVVQKLARLSECKI